MKITAIDIGGTAIKSATILANKSDYTSKYALNAFNRTPTNAKLGKDYVLNNILSIIDDVEKQYPSDAIAVSTAGTIDWDSGVITYATSSLPNFTGLELRRIIRERFQKDVIVINDAVAALIGEAFYMQPLKNVMMLTLGTGLGCAVLKDGILLADSIDNPAFAHTCLHINGRLCACGKKGCAEQYISATGLKKTLGGLSKENFIKPLSLDKFYKDFVKLLDIAQKNYCIDKIILGGGVIEQKEYWLDGLLNTVCKMGKPIQIEPAVLGNQAGLFGAVYAYMNGKFKYQLSEDKNEKF